MKHFIVAISLGLALILLVALILGLPVMWLWNSCLVPAVDGVHEIGFWQAIGLTILTSVLFKSTSVSKN